MADTKKGLFEVLYGIGEEALKAAKKPLVKSQLKRRFQAAYDNAEGQKIDLENKLADLRKNLDNLDINKILSIQTEITDLSKAQDGIKSEYLEFFAKDMPIVDTTSED